MGKSTPSINAINAWKFVQFIFWLVGIGLLLFMMFLPELGVILFWNILIPVAPALLVVATGVWRNICPLATTALIPDKLGISRKKKLSNQQRGLLNLVGVILLFLIIPLRHLWFNTNGQATAVIIISLAGLAVAYGFVFERKSGWCSGICPIHPVERLYGSGVVETLPNAHCNECVRCSAPCPDSTSNYTPLARYNSSTSKAVELLIVGAFPGYIWGWFQVPDYLSGWQNAVITYAYPILGGLLTLTIYSSLRELFHLNERKMLISVFAAAAVSCYYWFRLPMLFGFSDIDNNGILIDLTGLLPSWSMLVLNLVTTGFFFWWMVFRKKPIKSWAVRPVFAEKGI